MTQVACWECTYIYPAYFRLEADAEPVLRGVRSNLHPERFAVHPHAEDARPGAGYTQEPVQLLQGQDPDHDGPNTGGSSRAQRGDCRDSRFRLEHIG